MTSIFASGSRPMLYSQMLVQMRTQLDELQRQLATGKRAESYGGLGIGRSLDLEARTRLARIDTYETTIFNVDLRVRLINTSLERLRAIGQETRADTRFSLTYQLVGGGQTAAQRASTLRLDEALSLLNEKAGDRYLFSGRATDRAATDTAKHILDGDGSKAGLRQVMAERLLADQGADQRGRLLAPAAALSVVTLEENGVHPFGFKLASATSDFGATISGPAGLPPALTIDLGATNPPEGGRLSIRLTLPDGSTHDIELAATATVPPPKGTFAIGATVDDTAQNLATAVDAEIQRLARTELAAASAIQASQDFFAIDAGNPPQRVAGPPFDTATALVDATANNTVRWYVGDDATDNARTTAIARVDDTITVAYGVRGNEEALRRVIQHTAAFAAMTFSETDANARERYFALARRVGAALDLPDGVQRIEAIQTEIAGANFSAAASKSRLADKRPVLQGLIDEIENVSPEEVGVKLLALNTRMQATLQTTALLSRFTLLDFI